MQRIPYSRLMVRVAHRLGWNPSELSGAGKEFDTLRDAIGQAVEECWHRAWWRDTTRVERRQMRDTYDEAVEYAPTDEVFDPASEAYYQALTTTTGNPPTVLDNAGERTVNEAYWAVCALDYEADDYDATATYEVGDQVRDADSGLYYQCHTGPTTDAPTETAAWGVLTDFVPSVPYTATGWTTIGRVKGVYTRDPRKYPEATPLEWDASRDGLLLLGPLTARPWIEYKARAPQFFGDLYDADETYNLDDDTEGGDTSIVYTGVTVTTLLDWANSGNYKLTNRVYDDEDVLVSATVKWRDGITGVYTTTKKNTLWNKVDAWTMTYALTGAVVTQPEVTRDGRGNITIDPDLVVSGYLPVSAGGTIINVKEVYADADELRAAIVVLDLVAVLDIEGVNTLYVRDTASTADDDGVNTLIDAAGVRYTRLNT